MRPRAVLGASLLLLVVGQACGPLMIERDGHRVFNPAYRRFLHGSGRDAWQEPERVISALPIAEGSAVADVGAGTGYFTWRLAERVGASGRVYATDVQEQMIDDLHRLVEERGLANVTIVRARFDDPTLPPGCCDLVFFSNVYKEIDDRVPYMRKVARSLRPGGHVAIVGFRPDAPGPGPPRRARLPAEQVVGELEAAGFTLAQRHDFLARQHFLVFSRPDAVTE